MSPSMNTSTFVRHLVHEPPHPAVDRLDVGCVGIPQPTEVAPLQLDHAIVHRPDPLVLHLAGLDVDRRRLGGVERIEGVDRDEELVGTGELPERLDARLERALGRLGRSLESRDLAFDPVCARRPRQSRTGPPDVGETRPFEHRVVGHVGGLDAAGTHALGHDRLPVPDRVVAGHGRQAVGALPVAEGIRAHAGHERAPNRQRRHALRDGAVESQRVAGELVEVRCVGARPALERVHVVGANQGQHDEEGARRAALVGLGGRACRQRQSAEHARAHGAGSASPQQAAASKPRPHPPITAFAPLDPNCGSVPPASSSRTFQSMSTISGLPAATSRSSCGSRRRS